MIVGQSVRHGRHSFLQYATHFTQLLTDNIKMDTALDFNFQYYSFNNIDQNIYFCWLCGLKYSCISGWQSRLFVVMDGHVCSVLIIFIIIQYGNSTHSLIISFSSLSLYIKRGCPCVCYPQPSNVLYLLCKKFSKGVIFAL